MKFIKNIDEALSVNLITSIIGLFSFSTGLLIHQLTKLFIYYIIPQINLKDALSMLTIVISLLFISALFNLYLLTKINDEPKLTEHGYYTTKNGAVLCPFHDKPLPTKLTYLTDDHSIKIYRCLICQRDFDKN